MLSEFEVKFEAHVQFCVAVHSGSRLSPKRLYRRDVTPRNIYARSQSFPLRLSYCNLGCKELISEKCLALSL